MAVPWLKIVQLVPTIVDVSRELLKRSKREDAVAAPPQTDAELAGRVVALEENERRQAELVSQMAEQLATLTEALTALRRQVFWLMAVAGFAVVLALVAVAIKAS